MLTPYINIIILTCINTNLLIFLIFYHIKSGIQHACYTYNVYQFELVT